MSKTILALKIFKFLSWLYHVGKQLDKKSKVIFKIYDVTDYTTNNYNTHIGEYLKK